LRPRQRIQLLPEPRDHYRHVEAEDECHRDQVVVFLAVFSQVIKPSNTDKQFTLLFKDVSSLKGLLTTATLIFSAIFVLIITLITNK